MEAGDMNQRKGMIGSRENISENGVKDTDRQLKNV
jgi:hypothetical protein